MDPQTHPIGGRSVRRMGFGAMQLPGPGVFGPPRDRDQALAVLRRALVAGVNHIDTSQYYGPDVANELIHEALYPYPDDLVIVSKIGGARDDKGGWISAQLPDELRAGVQANLRTLEIAQIPVMNLRRMDGEAGLHEQLDVMIAMRDEGLIGGIGLSNVSVEGYRAARERTEIACVQNAYNVADRSGQPVFDACRADGVAYVPFFPLGSAFFPDNPVLGAPAVRAVAERTSSTPAQVALAWLLRRPPTCCSSRGPPRSPISRRTWLRPRSSWTPRRWPSWTRSRKDLLHGGGAMSDQAKRPSYSHGASDTPLLGVTIGQNLLDAARAFGDREAMVDCPSGRRWSYEELVRDVDLLAAALIGLGIEKGDRVGIWAPNCPEWTLTQFATARIGAVLVTINPAYRTHEVGYVLHQSGCRLLVSATEFKTSDYRAMIDEVRPELGGALDDVVYLGTDAWAALTSAGGSLGLVEERAATLSFDDPINIQYTSGTTGFPKGATLSHHNILNNGFFVGERCGYREADRVCIPVPFYHCFGMVMGNLGAVTHGSCMVIPAPGFDPGATLRAVQDERCTSLYGVPTMWIAEFGLADFADYDLSSLRTGIMAGSPCPVEIMKRVVSDMGCADVTICYGMTETSPVSTQTRADDDIERRVSTVGTVHPHVEVKVVDPETGLVVERGQPGEFCTRGYSVMLGYWDDEERTEESIDAAGWMHTGDLATMDDAGYLNIVGRIKDMVIRGGENVYPREIEEYLYSHPAVRDVSVVGVPDQRYGEELCAWVCLAEGSVADEDELRAFCRASLAHFKVPRYVLFVEEFPMTVTGKIQKYKMREVSIERLGLESAATRSYA